MTRGKLILVYRVTEHTMEGIYSETQETVLREDEDLDRLLKLYTGIIEASDDDLLLRAMQRYESDGQREV